MIRRCCHNASAKRWSLSRRRMHFSMDSARVPCCTVAELEQAAGLSLRVSVDHLPSHGELAPAGTGSSLLSRTLSRVPTRSRPELLIPQKETCGTCPVAAGGCKRARALTRECDRCLGLESYSPAPFRRVLMSFVNVAMARFVKAFTSLA